MLLKLDTGSSGTSFQAFGAFQLTAIPDMLFQINCTLSSASLVLTASAMPKEPINLFGAFYLGNTSIAMDMIMD